MTRVVLYAVPAVAVLVVAFSLLVVAAPRPVVGARLYGGPTPDDTHLTFRLLVVEQQGDSAAPVGQRPVAVSLRDQAVGLARWEGQLDEEGSASVALESDRPLPKRPVLIVTAPWAPEPLAVGTLELPAPSEAELPTPSVGGWIESPQGADLTIRVAAARGVLAVPFETTLLVQVTRSKAPVADVALEVDAEGLEVLARPRPTNDRGRTTIRIRPAAHVVALEVKARSPSGVRGRWYSTLPVVGGAMLAEVSPLGQLVVRSPIPRERAYYTVVTSRGRVAGGTVRLQADGHGGAVGGVPFQRPSNQNAWIVVSSEMDLAAPSTVGWPLVDAEREFLSGKLGQPPRARAIADVLLMDGVGPLEREERARQTRVRRLTVLFVVTAMALVVLLLMLRVHDSERRLREHLARTADGAGPDIAPSRGKSFLAVTVAVLCIMLGFLILVLVAMLRE